GIFYALILVPLGFVGSSNMVNMLAGFNGLETGMGIVYTGMLGLYAYVNQSYVAALIALLTFCSLLAFFIYTKSPAKILPGDSLTYLLGAVIAVIAIVGNLERAAIICSIPFILELILKSRARLHANNYGYYKNGKIMSLHGKNVYSLTHLFTRTGRFTENQIVYSFIVMELIISSLIWI
ncbi:MAG: glycosyl transferase family 4, partial [Nanoarchaeota archaeon]